MGHNIGPYAYGISHTRMGQYTHMGQNNFMTFAVDKMDWRGHINAARRERLPKKSNVTRYYLQKDYREDGSLHL